MTGPIVILALKVAVSAVTVLLAASLLALAAGRPRLHGRINLAFFGLTVAALVAFELVIRVFRPDAFDYIRANPELHRALQTHLWFAIPSALLMPVMLYTGLTRKRRAHIALAFVFGALWLGTFYTGVFTLPHGG
jgi:hypothetical protein